MHQQRFLGGEAPGLSIVFGRELSVLDTDQEEADTIGTTVPRCPDFRRVPNCRCRDTHPTPPVLFGITATAREIRITAVLEFESSFHIVPTACA